MSISIQFPSNSSKLQSSSLKKPPKPIDWIQQSYIEMIEDVSFSSPVTTPTIQEPNKTITIHLNEQKAYTHFSTIHEEEDNCCDHDSGKLLVTEDDDISECGYTYTTSSTDYNRKNNVFQFYKEQQQLNKVCPIDEELTTFHPHPQEEEVRIIQPAETKKKYKTKFKMIGRLITEKMKLTAEKPFWSIDNRF